MMHLPTPIGTTERLHLGALDGANEGARLGDEVGVMLGSGSTGTIDILSHPLT
jgi:hypothetical protein